MLLLLMGCDETSMDSECSSTFVAHKSKADNCDVGEFVGEFSTDVGEFLTVDWEFLAEDNESLAKNGEDSDVDVGESSEMLLSGISGGGGLGGLEPCCGFISCFKISARLM